jgi:Ca2+-binding EF-hand superfamily protein
MAGLDPIEALSEEDILQLLRDAFDEFDKDKSGEMGIGEFTQAWGFLGLKGTPEEINDAFKQVDVDNSGVVSFKEFAQAIKSNRLSEMSVSVVLRKMDGQLGNLGKYMDKVRGDLDVLRKTEQRRRLMKEEWEANIDQKTLEIIDKLNDALGNPKREIGDEEKFYNTLQETFNAYDADGSRQLGLPEYIESMRFLGKRESDEVLTQAFRSVDVDNSGQIDWPEYVFSVLGSKAAQYGTLARMEELSTLLDSTAGLLDNLRGSLAESQQSQAARAKRKLGLSGRM